MTKQPLMADLKRILALQPGERRQVCLVEIVDEILRSPRALPPLPSLARAHAERLAIRVREPKNFSVDSDGDARERLQQWQRWYALVRDQIEADGCEMLAELWRLTPRDFKRFDELSARVTAAIKALRALDLPWWPTHRTFQGHGPDMNLLDWCESRVSAIETARIRSGIFVGAKQTAKRRDVDDASLDEWAPSGDLLGGSR